MLYEAVVVRTIKKASRGFVRARYAASRLFIDRGGAELANEERVDDASRGS